MDIASFAAQLAAARRIEVTVDSVLFRLEMPSEHAWRLAVEANRDIQGRVLQAQAFRSVLEAAVTGWDGLKTTHILPTAPDELLPFTPSARTMLLDARQDIADELSVAIGEKLAERREQRESARKN